MNIILASASPRRRELLQNMGLNFEIIVSENEERFLAEELPKDTVMRLSMEKAANVADNISYDDCVVIGADTVVSIDNKILGKPHDEEDAARMLRMLSGKTHIVYTGVSVIEKGSGKKVNDFVATEVTFRTLNDEQIKNYIMSGEPMDKAGAYGIQQLGAMLVERINGDYFNVVGLPVSKLGQILSEEFGIVLMI